MPVSIVVPAVIVSQLRVLAATWAGGIGMFTTGLSADGSLPPTHFISSGMIDPTVASALGDANEMVALLKVMEPTISVTYEEIQALMDMCNISSGDPWSLLAELKLQPVNDIEE